MLIEKIKNLKDLEIEINANLVISILKFFIPFIISGITIFILSITISSEYFSSMIYTATTYFFTGKLIAIPAGIASGLSVNIAIMIGILMDSLICLFLIWNFDLIRKVPHIGNLVKKTEEKSSGFLEKHHWIQELAILGLATLVAIDNPFIIIGSMGGTVLGKLIGMKSWEIFIGVILGSILGCCIVGLASTGLINFIKL